MFKVKSALLFTRIIIGEFEVAKFHYQIDSKVHYPHQEQYPNICVSLIVSKEYCYH